MKRFICLIVTFFASIVSAQAIDFKGVGFGSTQAEIENAEPLLTCSPSVAEVWDKVCSFSPEMKCINRLDSDGAKCRAEVEARMTYAGEKADIMFLLIGGKFEAGTATVNSSSFDAVASALESKYGKPTSDVREVVQNRMGASFEGRKVLWQLPQGIELRADKFAGGKLTRSRIVMESQTSKNVMKASAEKKSKNAKDDL